MAARASAFVAVSLFLTLLCITQAFSNSDEYNSYTIVDLLKKEELIYFNDLAQHYASRRLRRDVSNTNNLATTTLKSTSVTASPGENVKKATYSSQQNVTKPSESPVSSINAANITSPTIVPKTMQSKLDHNLGENGTGIYYGPQLTNSTSNPTNSTLNSTICVSEPINPDKDNSSIGLEYESDEKLFAENNSTHYQVDSHEYYNSTFIINKAAFDEYWQSMLNNGKATVNQVLSQAHRRAATINLSFTFPFYGYNVTNVTIATGGFLYIGDHIHKWLAATQFIAPLMANFDTSLGSDSYVKFIDNGTSLTVIWENVTLQDKNETEKFTFATTLQSNGDITFAYKDVPVPIESIQSEEHPVKVGLSDAYMVNRVFFLTRRKTIYEYHRVSFRSHPITNNTLIYFTALPTCLQYDTCSSCLQHDTTFECTWCSNVNRCSSGNDRYRQNWIVNNCDEAKITKISDCSALSQPTDIPNKNYTSVTNKVEHDNLQFTNQAHTETKSTAVAFILTGLIIILAAGAWIVYAYRNPHTYSGQLLIKYRPSQWGWRRGEARYTAATIHM